MSAAKKSSPSVSMIVTLVSVATVCGALIVSAYELTLPVIKKNKAEQMKAAVFEVIHGAERIAVFVEKPDGTYARGTEDSTGPRVFAGYRSDGSLAGVAVEAAGQGFQDVISLLYGYSPAQQVIMGINVLESKETPGLGDKINNDPGFIANFKALDVRLADGGKGLKNPVTVVKHGEKTHPWEIDAITGATISSKAVGRILDESTESKLPGIAKDLDVLRGGK